MQGSYYGQAQNHNNSITKGQVQKKNKNVTGMTGMLATLHPSGTINQGGNTSVNAGLLSTDLKMTMKHNSSN